MQILLINQLNYYTVWLSVDSIRRFKIATFISLSFIQDKLWINKWNICDYYNEQWRCGLLLFYQRIWVLFVLRILQDIPYTKMHVNMSSALIVIFYFHQSIYVMCVLRILQDIPYASLCDKYNKFQVKKQQIYLKIHNCNTDADIHRSF